MPRRLAPLLLVAIVVSGACSSPLLSRTATPGTVHARVVTSAGGSRLLLVPVFVGSRGPYDFALDTGAAASSYPGVMSRELLSRRPSVASTLTTAHSAR